MLDLKPIKARLDAVNLAHYVLYDGTPSDEAMREVERHAHADLSAMIAEVERQRAIIADDAAKYGALRVEVAQLHVALSELTEVAEESWPNRPAVAHARSVLNAWPART